MFVYRCIHTYIYTLTYMYTHILYVRVYIYIYIYTLIPIDQQSDVLYTAGSFDYTSSVEPI